VGGVQKNNLLRPLDGLTGMNLDLQEDISALFGRCEVILGISMVSAPTSDAWSTFARLDVRAEEKQKAAELPFHAELKNRVNEQMKRIDSGSREVLRLLLMYGELTEDNAIKLVKESGKYTNSTFGLIGLDNQTGWLKKTRSSPFPNVSRGEDAYVVSESIKSILVDWFSHNVKEPLQELLPRSLLPPPQRKQPPAEQTPPPQLHPVPTSSTSTPKSPASNLCTAVPETLHQRSATNEYDKLEAPHEHLSKRNRKLRSEIRRSQPAKQQEKRFGPLPELPGKMLHQT
jgi:hypothetical protein